MPTSFLASLVGNGKFFLGKTIEYCGVAFME